MAFIRTMEQAIGWGQRRADKETDPHVDTDEWKELISDVFGELHGAVSETGARYFETEATITATGAASYSLPDAHLSTIGIDRVLDAVDNRLPLDQLMVQERPFFSGVTGDARFWSFSGTNIVLHPKPTTGTYKHLYVPQPTDYSAAANSQQIDFINIHGWKFVQWGVASIAMHKGDANQMRAVDERDRAMAKLMEWAVARALTMPKRRIVTETELIGMYGNAWSPADWRFTPP